MATLMATLSNGVFKLLLDNEWEPVLKVLEVGVLALISPYMSHVRLGLLEKFLGA